ncbi:MAG: hypothetical protein HY290_20875 [Planctomycetia bacterium]|nr:hypothetical protein [Planctomycetia bacterium]
MLAGCASPGTKLVECPLSIEQQQQAVLEVVPRGSTRAEAERRLKEAGIEFSPGQKNSIYYLSLWNRPNGQRWHINVALLFDGQGKLYQSRAGDSGIGPLTADEPAGSRTPGGARKAGGNFPAAVSTGSSRDDDELKHVPFPEQYETGKGAR